jgi:hypothetical protein
MDPEDLREVISAYQKCVAETVRGFDGFVANHISRLASRDAAKSLLSTLVSESSGECRLPSLRYSRPRQDRNVDVALYTVRF